MNSKHHESDAFEAAIQMLVMTTKEICKRTQAVCAKRLNLKDDISNVLSFQQRCYLRMVVTTDVK